MYTWNEKYNKIDCNPLKVMNKLHWNSFLAQSSGKYELYKGWDIKTWNEKYKNIGWWTRGNLSWSVEQILWRPGLTPVQWEILAEEIRTWGHHCGQPENKIIIGLPNKQCFKKGKYISSSNRYKSLSSGKSWQRRSEHEDIIVDNLKIRSSQGCQTMF